MNFARMQSLLIIDKLKPKRKYIYLTKDRSAFVLTSRIPIRIISNIQYVILLSTTMLSYFPLRVNNNLSPDFLDNIKYYPEFDQSNYMLALRFNLELKYIVILYTL